MGEIKFHLYGNESVSDDLAVYAVVATTNEYIRIKINEIKKEFGGTERNEIHCAKFFNRKARAKTAWSHLDEKSWFEMLRNAASICPGNMLSGSL